MKCHELRDECAQVRECSALKLRHTYTQQKHSKGNVSERERKRGRESAQMLQDLQRKIIRMGGSV